MKPGKVLVSMITSDKFCKLTMCRVEKYFPFICSESAAFNITEYLLYFCLWQKTISSCQYTFECSSLFHMLLIVLSFYCSLKERVPKFVRKTLCSWLFLSLSLKLPYFAFFFFFEKPLLLWPESYTIGIHNTKIISVHSILTFALSNFLNCIC